MLDRILAKAVSKMIREQKRIVFMPYSESSPKQIIQSYGLQSYLVMLNDKNRIGAYQKVIEKNVKNKIVLEIGTGAHAPLARACAKAGAKKIYAIEANPRALRSVKKILKKEGLEKIIALIPGYSTEVTLPTKAEILVQDMIGNIGSAEGMVAFMSDAKKRLLTDNAMFIPEIIKTYVVPVQKPIEATPWLMKLSNRMYWWKNPPKKMAVMNFPRSHFIAVPGMFENFILNKPIDEYPQKSFTFKIEKDSVFDGFLFWIQVQFDKETLLDCLSGTSWCSVFVPVSESFTCTAGDQIFLHTDCDLSATPKYNLHTEVTQNGKTKTLSEISC